MDRQVLISFLRDMLLARAFEERAAIEYQKGNIAGFLHLYPGEEAVAVGVLHAAEPSDYVVTAYREHVHAIVRGIAPALVMAELFGRKNGVCSGMGGSMHLFSREHRFMGGYAIVGEPFPIAAGIAYAVAMRRLPEAVICFFGDGSVNQGTFHESLNMAALWRLPVLFVCENNQYQIGTEIHRHSAVTELYRRALAYNIAAERIQGMDVVKVFESASRALQQIREGAGPQFLEYTTYRFRGHSMSDPGAYRPRAEVQAFKSFDPIISLTRELGLEGDTGASTVRDTDSEVDLAALTRIANEIVDEAVSLASAGAQPTLHDAFHFAGLEPPNSLSGVN